MRGDGVSPGVAGPEIAPPAPSPTRTRGWGWIAALLATTRPLSSLVSGTLAASAALAGHGAGVSAIVAGLAMTALAMFGFTVNDIFDYRKDRAAEVRRPVATGELSRRAAAWLAASALAAACVFAGLAGPGKAVFGAAAIALGLYSPAAHRLPLSKDVYIAALCCAPLYYGGAVGGHGSPWYCYAVLACFVLGREALMDADEVMGDSSYGMRTIAALLGSRRTARAGAALMLLAAAALASIARGPAGRWTSFATLLLLAAVFAWPGLEQRRRIHLSRLPMLLGSVAIVLSGV